MRRYARRGLLGRAAGVSLGLRDQAGHDASACVQRTVMMESFSLWVVPTGTAAEVLTLEIETQAQKYDGPRFPPHVTVAPCISGTEADVVSKSQRLAASLKPYFVPFLDVTYGAIFFQCVYLLCVKDAAVMAAAEAARKAFDLTTPPYMPHLSLLYSDIDPSERQAAAQQAVARLYGDKGTYNTLLPEQGFWARTLQLWYTPDDATCKSWRLVGEYALGGEQQ